nr:MAG TPA: ERF superfamily protein [Caudoviricetes sp.]
MLNEKIIKIKNKFYESKIEKTGRNEYGNKFEYFELKDFLPSLIKLMAEEEVNDVFSINNEFATLKLIYKDEVNEYMIPFVMFDVPISTKGSPIMQKIQYLGALSTYYKRYLYMNAFSITENDIIDAINNNDIANNKNSKQKETKKKLSEEEKVKIATNLISKMTSKYQKTIDDFFKIHEVDNINKLNNKEILSLYSKIKELEKKGV